MYIWSILTELGGCSPTTFFYPLSRFSAFSFSFLLTLIRRRRRFFTQLCFTSRFLPASPPFCLSIVDIVFYVFPLFFYEWGCRRTELPLFQVYGRAYIGAHTHTHRHVCGRLRGWGDSFAFSSTLSLSSFFCVLRWQPLRLRQSDIYLFLLLLFLGTASLPHLTHTNARTHTSQI